MKEEHESLKYLMFGTLYSTVQFSEHLKYIITVDSQNNPMKPVGIAIHFKDEK